MIELELELGAFESMNAANFPRAKIDILHVGFDHVDVAQNPAQRIHNVARRKIARRDFMQHRREENEILPRDQRYFDIRPTRQMLVQIFCRVEPGKSAACDHDLCLLHVESIRAALRCCERLCFFSQHSRRAWLHARAFRSRPVLSQFLGEESG